MKYNIRMDQINQEVVDDYLNELTILLYSNPVDYVKLFLDLDAGKIDRNDDNLIMAITSTSKIVKLKIRRLSENYCMYYMNIPMLGSIAGEIEYVK